MQSSDANLAIKRHALQRLDSPPRARSAKFLAIIPVLMTIGCIAGLSMCQRPAFNDLAGGQVSAGHPIAVSRAQYGASNTIDQGPLKRDSSSQPIPKILHHVYLGNLEDLWKAERTPGPQPGVRFPAYNRTIRRSCPQRHEDWRYMFWNSSQAEFLIQSSYPWFLETFASYKTNVQKSNLILL